MIEAEAWHALEGTEKQPGVDIVWGVAYRIDPEKEAEVRAYMEHREKVGWLLVLRD